MTFSFYYLIKPHASPHDITNIHPFVYEQENYF